MWNIYTCGAVSGRFFVDNSGIYLKRCKIYQKVFWRFPINRQTPSRKALTKSLPPIELYNSNTKEWNTYAHDSPNLNRSDTRSVQCVRINISSGSSKRGPELKMAVSSIDFFLSSSELDNSAVLQLSIDSGGWTTKFTGKFN